MASNASRKPRILLISLRCESFFDEMYKPLIDKLRARAIVQRVKNQNDALYALSETKVSAILITDAALTKGYVAVWDAVLKYVHEGGTAVCMGQFSGFVRPLDIKPFFQKAGLQWEAGDYLRTTVELNRGAVGTHLVASLPPRYSQKAVFLKNVAEGAKWYRSNNDSVVESLVFDPTRVNNRSETPVALAKVGKGKLGYIGDVNAEVGSEAVVLAMCGLSA